MRAIAACQFTLSQFVAWRAFVAALTSVVVLGLLAWAVCRPSGSAWAATAALGCLLLVACTFGVTLARVETATLSWDGHRWLLGPPESMGRVPQAGSLAVAIDLGSWMLLRFRAEGDSGWVAATWLPVQRRGLELQWHAFRCAVYSPRPAVGVGASADH